MSKRQGAYYRRENLKKKKKERRFKQLREDKMKSA